VSNWITDQYGDTGRKVTSSYLLQAVITNERKIGRLENEMITENGWRLKNWQFEKRIAQVSISFTEDWVKSGRQDCTGTFLQVGSPDWISRNLLRRWKK